MTPLAEALGLLEELQAAADVERLLTEAEEQVAAAEQAGLAAEVAHLVAGIDQRRARHRDQLANLTERAEALAARLDTLPPTHRPNRATRRRIRQLIRRLTG